MRLIGTDRAGVGRRRAASRRTAREQEDLPMTPGVRTTFGVVGLFLLVQALLVHCLGPGPPSAVPDRQAEVAAAPKSSSRRPPLPESAMAPRGCRAPSQDMREAILARRQIGPDRGSAACLGAQRAQARSRRRPGGDPVAHWKQISGDGEGREFWRRWPRSWTPATSCCRSAAISRTTDLRLALFRRGAARQAHAGTGGRAAAPRTAAAPKDMRATGKYTHWRLAIGADGDVAFFPQRSHEYVGRGPDCTQLTFKLSSNLLYMQTCESLDGGLGHREVKGKTEYVARGLAALPC